MSVAKLGGGAYGLSFLFFYFIFMSLVLKYISNKLEEIMKNIKAELLHFTPSKILVIAAGIPHKNPNADGELVRRIIVDRDHGSVAEHMSFTFLLDGGTRAFLHELIRHRIASYTIESTRYILNKTMQEIKLCIPSADPTEFLRDYYAYPELAEAADKMPPDYDMNHFVFKLLMQNLSAVANMERAYDADVPPDVYKYMLGENFRIRLVWTINLRSMLNFLMLRTDKSAHFEIRHVANLVRTQLCRIPLVRKIILGKEGIVLW